MFDYTQEIITDNWVHKYKITIDSTPVSYAEVLNLWQCDRKFRSWFIAILSKSPFLAYRWETPPITIKTINRNFEFVLLNSPGLAQFPDAQTFTEYFAAATNNDIVVFENLGRDSILVVPAPLGPNSVYSHLALFIRDAPESQKHDLWRIVGQTVQQQLTDKPLWISTAGGGVAWLHVRLDSRPKYYGHAAYQSLL